MTKGRATALLLSGLLFGVAGRANGGVITFGGVSPTDTCLSTIATGGLTFTENGNGCLGVWNDSPNTPGIADLILGEMSSADVAITATAGGPFNLGSLDMTLSWYDTMVTDPATVTADFQSGGSSNQVLNLVQGLQVYNLNLSSVSEVDITAPASGTGYWAIDSIGYSTGNAIPEPAQTIPVLMLAGMMVVVVALRRSRSNLRI